MTLRALLTAPRAKLMTVTLQTMASLTDDCRRVIYDHNIFIIGKI